MPNSCKFSPCHNSQSQDTWELSGIQAVCQDWKSTCYRNIVVQRDIECLKRKWKYRRLHQGWPRVNLRERPSLYRIFPSDALLQGILGSNPLESCQPPDEDRIESIVIFSPVKDFWNLCYGSPSQVYHRKRSHVWPCIRHCHWRDCCSRRWLQYLPQCHSRWYRQQRWRPTPKTW